MFKFCILNTNVILNTWVKPMGRVLRFLRAMGLIGIVFAIGLSRVRGIWNVHLAAVNDDKLQ